MADQDEEKGRKKLIVAAIDFGSTFSGWAYQFKHDHEGRGNIIAKDWNNGTNISSKTPTTVLIRPDSVTFEAFGYEAEDKYAELIREEQHKDWYYFSGFKMMLHENMKLKRGMLLEASNGKKLPAIDIYTAAIRYLKEDVMKECQVKLAGKLYDDEFLWVLTVPAIWTDAAKQFMREAGRKAGIEDTNWILALEPEAASVFCKHDCLQKQASTEVTSFTPGSRYIVLDAGGGTVDITVHEILPNGNIKELHRPCGGCWGGSMVDAKFHQLLSDIFGQLVMETFKEEAQDDYLALSRTFEVRKRSVSSENTKPTMIDIPHVIVDVYKTQTGRSVMEALEHGKYAGNDLLSISKRKKLAIGSDIMMGIFDESITNITSEIDELLKDVYVQPCGIILLVGGFSESPMLKETLQAKFNGIEIISPREASLAVLKGAVLSGRKQSIISHRICRFTYGYNVMEVFEEGDPEEYMIMDGDVAKCNHRFEAIVTRGTVLNVNETQQSKSMSIPPTGSSEIAVELYKSNQCNPRYVTEQDCVKMGSLATFDLEGETDMICQVGGKFGGTEIQLEITHLASGKVVSGRFDNLD